MTTREEIGHRVREARRSAGLSQQTVADAIGMERSGLSDAENGKRNITATELASLARVLNRSILWILGEEQGEPAAEPGFMVTPLVAALMEKSLTETFAVGNLVTEAWEQDAKRAQAALDLVRMRISRLIKGPWMPTTDALRSALWPFDEEIDAYMAGDGDAK